MWSFMSALLATGIMGMDVSTLIWAGVIMAQIVINIVVLIVLAAQSSKGKKRETASEKERAELKKAIDDLKQKVGEPKADPADYDELKQAIKELSEKVSEPKVVPVAENDELKREIKELSDRVAEMFLLLSVPKPEPNDRAEEPKLAILTFKEGASVVLSVPESEEDGYNEEDYIWYINGEQKLKGRVFRAEEGLTEGEYQVRVCCKDVPVNLFKIVVEHEEKIAESAVAVAAPVKEKRAAFDEEDSVEGGTLRYNRSFTARMIQSDDAAKRWYTLIKNQLLNYNKVKARMSWKKESFRVAGSAVQGGEARTVALLSHRGKTLCLFLPLKPEELEDSKYKIESAGKGSYKETPCLYRIKNEKRMRYALELIDTVMEKLGVKRIERESEDFYLPYEGTVELIEKGLIKRVIKSRRDEAIFDETQK